MQNASILTRNRLGYRSVRQQRLAEFLEARPEPAGPERSSNFPFRIAVYPHRVYPHSTAVLRQLQLPELPLSYVPYPAPHVIILHANQKTHRITRYFRFFLGSEPGGGVPASQQIMEGQRGSAGRGHRGRHAVLGGPPGGKSPASQPERPVQRERNRDQVVAGGRND